MRLKQKQAVGKTGGTPHQQLRCRCFEYVPRKQSRSGYSVFPFSV